MAGLTHFEEHGGLFAAERGEPGSTEKPGLAGDGEEFSHASCTGSLFAEFDEFGSDSAFLECGIHGQTAHLRQPFRIDLKGAAANDMVSEDRDQERRDRRQILLRQVPRVEFDQSTDGRHFAFYGGAKRHTRFCREQLA
jgi:hypothetical protein